VTLTLPYLAEQVDLSALDFAPNRERFDEILRGRRWFPDLVSDVRCRSGRRSPALAHVEIEYEYRSKRRAVLRDYNEVLVHGTGLSVHTAVIYLHGGPAGLEEGKHEDVSYGRVLRTFHYQSLGLARASAKEYLERPEPPAWAFAVLMSPKGFASRGELGVACVRRILGERGLDEKRRSLLLNFVRTYVKLDEKTAPVFEELLREPDNEEVGEMFMTWADEIKAEGLEQGKEQGKAEGLEQGKAEGLEQGKAEGVEKLRDIVLQLMSQRFGELSDRTRRAVAGIKSLDELAELAKRIFVVEGPEELLAGSR
jgi:hypothetical protein